MTNNDKRRCMGLGVELLRLGSKLIKSAQTKSFIARSMFGDKFQDLQEHEKINFTEKQKIDHDNSALRHE